MHVERAPRVPLANLRHLPGGQPQLLESGVSREFPGQYHASGKYYYFLDKGRIDMLTVRFDGFPPLITRPSTNRDGGQGISPAYSRDGKFLAYVSSNIKSGRVIVRNLETGSEND